MSPESLRDVAAVTMDNPAASALNGPPIALDTLGGQVAYQTGAAALTAVGRLYHYPSAHFHLGVAMVRLGWIDRAEQAFHVAVAQRPGFPEAHRWLARIYRDYLRDPGRAAHHLALSRGERPVPA